MTHPFHPLFDQELESVGECKVWGELRVYYQEAEGQVRALPVVWTDLSMEEAVMNVSSGRSVYRAAELLELVRLLERLRGRV